MDIGIIGLKTDGFSLVVVDNDMGDLGIVCRYEQGSAEIPELEAV